MSKRVLLFGASGTIGQAVALELRKAGHECICVVREDSQPPIQLSSYEKRFVNLSDPQLVLSNALKNEKFDVIISCIASRTGIPDDAWEVDYQCNSNILQAARYITNLQFILLSAICVQKPKLSFQKAKLAFEKKLVGSGVLFSIVRPTAFFKSLSGQIERVRNGKPFILLGNGEITRCKPVSDTDLAIYITGCINKTERHNRILPIGGPGPAITPLDQAKELFSLCGQKPRYVRIPIKILKLIIIIFRLVGSISKRAAQKSEYARIGLYYATESMLVWDDKLNKYDEEATPETGHETLFNFYAREIGKS